MDSIFARNCYKGVKQDKHWLIGQQLFYQNPVAEKTVRFREAWPAPSPPRSQSRPDKPGGAGLNEISFTNEELPFYALRDETGRVGPGKIAI